MHQDVTVFRRPLTAFDRKNSDAEVGSLYEGKHIPYQSALLKKTDRRWLLVKRIINCV